MDEFDVNSNSHAKNGICIIKVCGILGKEVDTKNNPNMMDIDSITCELQDAASDNSVKTIILDFDSPGGQVTGIEELGNLIKKISTQKPVYAFCDTICGSAAYWLASCSNGFGATKSSEIGSIGVFSLVEDHSERLASQGIRINAFFAGAMKLLGMPFKPMTDTEKAYIQEGIDAQYLKFITVVKENRGGVDDKYLQGQCLSGEDALQANLIDVVVNDMNEFIQTVQQIDTTSN